MKEVTHVLTVQFTSIAKGDDESFADFMQRKEEANAGWLKELRKVIGCDDIQIVRSQIFVQDVEG